MKTYGPVRALASEVWQWLEGRGRTPRVGEGSGALISLRQPEAVRLKGEEVKLFLTERPLAGDEVEVALRQLNGCTRLSVAVCKIDRNLQVTELWQLSFAKDRTLQRPIVKHLSGVQDHLVAVYIAGSSSTRICHLALTLAD